MLWSIATLKVSDDHVITALSQACVDRLRVFNAQNVSNALWSAAVLSITDTAITHSLISAVSDRFKSIIQFEAAQQCLQAHYFGLTLTEDAVKHCHAILLAHVLSLLLPLTVNLQFLQLLLDFAILQN
jgi:hypothetical protein